MALNGVESAARTISRLWQKLWHEATVLSDVPDRSGSGPRSISWSEVAGS